MRNFNFILLMAMSAVAVSAHAQTEQTDAAVSDETETAAAAAQQRPEMPNLFFRKEQRRVLEAVRQGVVAEEDFDIEEFVPVVIVEEELPLQFDETVAEARARPKRIHFDAYIVNKKTGERTLWMNGRELSAAEENSYLSRQGLEVSGLENEGEAAVLSGNDAYTDSQFKVQVGQVIDIDGTIEETLPIIIRTR